jgi:SAM-dependent methyltransferase
MSGVRRLILDSNIQAFGMWDGLDVGGRFINGSARRLLPYTTWTVLDIKAAPDVDIVADAVTWHPDHVYDVVLSTELLEHAPGWRKILRTCSSALRPGGYLFLSCASTRRPPHGANGEPTLPEGEYYANVAPEELLPELERLFVDVHLTYQYPPGDIYARGRKR